MGRRGGKHLTRNFHMGRARCQCAHAHTHTRTHAHTRTRAHAHTRTRAHAHTRTRARRAAPRVLPAASPHLNLNPTSTVTSPPLPSPQERQEAEEDVITRSSATSPDRLCRAPTGSVRDSESAHVCKIKCVSAHISLCTLLKILVGTYRIRIASCKILKIHGYFDKR